MMTAHERKILAALIAVFFVLAAVNAYFFFKHRVTVRVTPEPPAH